MKVAVLVLSLLGMFVDVAHSSELVRLVIQGAATQELALYDEEVESDILNCSQVLVPTHPRSAGGKVVSECFFEADDVRIRPLRRGLVRVEFSGEAVPQILDYLDRYGSRGISCSARAGRCSMVVETAEVVSLRPRVHPSVTVSN